MTQQAKVLASLGILAAGGTGAYLNRDKIGDLVPSPIKDEVNRFTNDAGQAVAQFTDTVFGKTPGEIAQSVAYNLLIGGLLIGVGKSMLLKALEESRQKAAHEATQTRGNSVEVGINVFLTDESGSSSLVMRKDGRLLEWDELLKDNPTLLGIISRTRNHLTVVENPNRTRVEDPFYLTVGMLAISNKRDAKTFALALAPAIKEPFAPLEWMVSANEARHGSSELCHHEKFVFIVRRDQYFDAQGKEDVVDHNTIRLAGIPEDQFKTLVSNFLRGNWRREQVTQKNLVDGKEATVVTYSDKVYEWIDKIGLEQSYQVDRIYHWLEAAATVADSMKTNDVDYNQTWGTANFFHTAEFGMLTRVELPSIIPNPDSEVSRLAILLQDSGTSFAELYALMANPATREPLMKLLQEVRE